MKLLVSDVLICFIIFRGYKYPGQQSALRRLESELLLPYERWKKTVVKLMDSTQ
jgi:hypothetical protein